MNIRFRDRLFWALYSWCYDVMEDIIPYKNLLSDMDSIINAQQNDSLLEIGSGTLNLTRVIDLSLIHI